jgi:hypothetical protein
MKGSMRRSVICACTSWGAAFLMLAGMPSAWAQGRPLSEAIVGGWSLGSVVLEQGGARQEPFGRNPVGFASFHPDGRFSYMIIRSDLPRIASGNRFTATPEEMKAIYLGTIAYFGKYAIDEASGTLLLHIEVSNFTNWSGTTERRLLSIKEGEMKLVNPSPPTGGTSYIVWKRAER